MNQSPQAVAQQAGQAAAAGRLAEAEALWTEVRRQDPKNVQALYSLGVHALHRRDLRGALDLLSTAETLAPGDPTVRMTTAVVLRDLGDGEGEWRMIHAALESDAYFLPALLAKGAFLERQGDGLAAATVYGHALTILPDETRWPGSLRDQFLHARTVVEADRQKLAERLVGDCAEAFEHLDDDEAARWREVMSITTRRSRPFASVCNQLHVPRLPAIPFFDRSRFDWVKALEDRTEAIRDEMQAALTEQAEAFTPYIAYRPGDPVNQWAELNHSPRWSTFSLWRGGVPVEANLDRCPQTAAALRDVEMAEIGGLCPNAMFSVLAPHTAIPPHNGETNARLVVHLPLVVPDRCRYRVGFEHRTWQVGETLIFDDTIEHEARNDSDDPRVVLIFDVWNPLLSMAERRMVQSIVSATRVHNGLPPGSD